MTHQRKNREKYDGTNKSVYLQIEMDGKIKVLITSQQL